MAAKNYEILWLTAARVAFEERCLLGEGQKHITCHRHTEKKMFCKDAVRWGWGQTLRKHKNSISSQGGWGYLNLWGIFLSNLGFICLKNGRIVGWPTTVEFVELAGVRQMPLFWAARLWGRSQPSWELANFMA